MNRNFNLQLLMLSLVIFLPACPIKFDGAGLGEESSDTGNITVNSSFNTFEFPTSGTLDTTNTLNTDALIITGLDSSTFTSSTGFESTSTSSDTDFDSTENRASTGGMISICGNYIVEPLEECDDGPLGSGECLSTCKFSFCGDGYLNNLAKEQCDDFNKIDDDDCSNECIKPRIVFLTSDYIGPPTFGGIQKADEYCQNDANKFGIPGIFRAWISDSNPKNDPVERFGDFLTFNGWYRLPSDPPKPVSKGAKFQFGLSVPIDIMPMGSKDLVVESVWTNTKPDGTAYDYINNCNNWTSNSPSLTYAGSPQSINSEWTLYGWKNCSSGVGSKLYCFETNQ